MTIVAAHRYRHGKVQETNLLPCSGLPGEGEFDWVGLVEPSAQEIEQVKTDYGLHPLAVEDALTQRHTPKAEAYGEQLFVIARTAAMGEGDKIEYGQTAIFLGKHYLSVDGMPLFVYEATVVHVTNAVGIGKDARIVRHDDRRLAFLGGESAE